MAAAANSGEPMAVMTAEADRARDRVAGSINALHDKLDPRRILADTLDRAQTGGRHFAAQAGDTAKAHPLAIGAAAVAIGLAVFARHRIAHATIDLGDDLAGYTDYDDDLEGLEGTESVTALRAPKADMASRPAVGDSTGAPRQAPKTTGQRGDTNPIVSILIGLAAGAALGVLLPTSDAERRALGETGGRLRRAANAAARQAADELGDVGARAGDAARQARDAAGSVVAAARSVVAAGRNAVAAGRGEFGA